MKHLKRFNETKNNDELTIYDVLIHMINIVEEYNVTFTDVDRRSVLNITENTLFNFYKDIHNKRIYRFGIVITGETINYDDYINVISDMQQIVIFLKNYGWSLYNHTSNIYDIDKHYELSTLDYEFIKPDEITESTVSLEDAISVDYIEEIFAEYGISVDVDSIKYNETDIEMEIDYEYHKEELQDAIDEVGSEMKFKDWTLNNEYNLKIIF